jgi:hypothetical protein
MQAADLALFNQFYLPIQTRKGAQIEGEVGQEDGQQGQDHNYG